jgi:hypothetical protein
MNYEDPRCLNENTMGMNAAQSAETVKAKLEGIARRKADPNSKGTFNYAQYVREWKAKRRRRQKIPTREEVLKDYGIDASSMKSDQSIKWIHNVNTHKEKLVVIKKGTAMGLKSNWRLGRDPGIKQIRLQRGLFTTCIDE